MRPKSMATVVVVLPGRCASMSRDTDVIGASVVSGVISEIEPTNVVFPTPKPPAMTILTGTGAAGAAGSDRVAVGIRSERLKAIQNPFEQLDVGPVARGLARTVDLEQALDLHVSHQHPGDAEVDAEVGRDLGDRQRPAAQLQDAPALQRLRFQGGGAGRRALHQRLEGQVDGRAGAATGQRIGPDAVAEAVVD